jgi:hypothetical protein
VILKYHSSTRKRHAGRRVANRWLSTARCTKTTRGRRSGAAQGGAGGLP